MITPAFFAKYDENENKINYLINTEADLANATAGIAQAKQQIREAQHILRNVSVDEKLYEERINRNEHPNFFHFFVQNRQQKVEQLKKEQKILNTKHASLEAIITDAGKRMRLYNENLTKATYQKQMLDKYLSKRQRMFEKCVFSVPSSPLLIQLDANIQQAKNRLSAEQSLKLKLTQTIAIMKKSQTLFEQSVNAYKRIGIWNEHILKYEECDTTGRLEKLTEQACTPAMHGYKVASKGLGLFPEALRERFPESACQIGAIPLPSLQSVQDARLKRSGSSSGSTSGADAVCVIQNNEKIAAECVRILQAQIDCCTSILASVDSSIGQLEDDIQSGERDRENEKMATFERIREFVCAPKSEKMSHLSIVPITQRALCVF